MIEWPFALGLAGLAFGLGWALPRIFARRRGSGGPPVIELERAGKLLGAGLFRVGPDGRFAVASEAVFELLEVDRSELAEGALFAGVRTAEREELSARWQKALAKRTPFEADRKVASADREARWLRIRAVPLEGSDQLWGAVIDITALKSAESDQEALRLQAAQSQKVEAIGLLASGIAHDFNNQLTPILLYASMGLRDKQGDERVAKAYRAIYDGAEECASLTRQLLDFSRKQPVKRGPIALKAVVSGLEKTLQRLLRENIRLSFSYAEEDGAALADINQMRQVLVNLALNAQDAMPDGGELAFSTYTAGDDRSAGGRLQCIRVADSGVGMSEAVRIRVFDPFFTTKETGKGTGLGLSVASGIVKQHGGSIQVESEEGKGTQFVVSLPTFDARLSEGEASLFEGVELRGTGQRVVVAEDDATLRALVSRVLADNGFAVHEARTPGEALAYAKGDAGKVDLLVTDVVMPDMNGGELFESMNRIRPGLRVLFMSGYDSSYLGPLADAHPFLAKPFSDVQLVKKAMEALQPAD